MKQEREKKPKKFKDRIKEITRMIMLWFRSIQSGNGRFENNENKEWR